MTGDREANQLRVPTVSLDAEIHYFDERPMQGRVFVPSVALHHAGPMRAEEWMNQPQVFFPFLLNEEQRTIILNKRYVVVLTLKTTEAGLAPDSVGMRRSILVECGKLEVRGTILIDMPESHSRLLDFVNQPGPFLSLVSGDRCHLIQKRRITSISEALET